MPSSSSDICLILEGTYPYVRGGVSTWTHELITRQNHLSFHILAILPRDDTPTVKFDLPANVAGITNIHLQQLPPGGSITGRDVLTELAPALKSLTTGTARLEDLKHIINTLRPFAHRIGSDYLLDGENAWKLLTSMYEEAFTESSFLDYFWSWRAILGGLYSLLLADLPPARAYHALSTGYAGVMAARARIETGKPVLLTEHGIYTNERRIEIASADWLEETASKSLTIDFTRRNLRDMWTSTFANYSQICYEACDEIITLFEGNQKAQIQDGAAYEKLRIIPNGVDVERFSSIVQQEHGRPTIALIGRVVPIKDVKGFLRACALMHASLPDLRTYIMGPFDEDPDYFEECRQMVDYLGLESTVVFTGQVKIDEYLPEIDLLVISSISEAQPLVILEAGACGIPCIATNVGACPEIIYGAKDEKPYLGEGGIIAPLSNPAALAASVLALLTNPDRYERCSETIRTRVATYYNKEDQHRAYRELYAAATGDNKKRGAA